MSSAKVLNCTRYALWNCAGLWTRECRGWLEIMSQKYAIDSTTDDKIWNHCFMPSMSHLTPEYRLRKQASNVVQNDSRPPSHRLYKFATVCHDLNLYPHSSQVTKRPKKRESLISLLPERNCDSPRWLRTIRPFLGALAAFTRLSYKMILKYDSIRYRISFQPRLCAHYALIHNPFCNSSRINCLFPSTVSYALCNLTYSQTTTPCALL